MAGIQTKKAPTELERFNALKAEKFQQSTLPPLEEGAAIDPSSEYAGFVPTAWAYAAQNTDTKVRIFAGARFPEIPIEEAVKKYGSSYIDPGKGRISYEDENGNLKYETGTGFNDIWKRMGATMFGSLPSTGTETIAAMKNMPVKAAFPLLLAGAAGNVIMKWAGTGEAPNSSDAITQGIGLGVGTANQGLVRGLNQSSQILENLEEIPESEIAKTTARQVDFMNSTGVPLPLDQASQNTDFEMLGGIIRTRIGTSNTMVQNLNDQVSQMGRQVDDFVIGLNSARNVDGSNVAFRTVQKAQDMAAKLKQARTDAVNAKYADAYNDGINPDAVVDGIIKITEGMENLTTSGKRLYKTYLDELYDVAPSPDEPDGIITGNIQRIHNARKELDVLYSEGGKIPADVYFNLRTAISDILKTNAKFADADARFEGMSQALAEEMAGIFGRLAEKQIPDQERLVRDFFNPNLVNVPHVLKAKKQIQGDDPELWNDILKVYMNGVIQKAKAGAAKGGEFNVFWNLHKELWAFEPRRNILRAAMSPQQYETFEKVMMRSKLVGRNPNIGSPTEPRQAANEVIKDNARSPASQFIQLFRIINWLESLQVVLDRGSLRKFMSDLTDTFLKPGGAEDVNAYIATSKFRKNVTGLSAVSGQNTAEAIPDAFAPQIFDTGDPPDEASVSPQ